MRHGCTDHRSPFLLQAISSSAFFYAWIFYLISKPPITADEQIPHDNDSLISQDWRLQCQA